MKNNVLLDTDSAAALMQEIYNDITEQKNYASLIMKKMLSFMKDSEDMSTIGPVIKEQQKILNECTEKKISLVKLQNIFIKQLDSSLKGSGGGKLTLNDEDRKLLEKLISDDDNDQDRSENYKI
jgi:hypothetical protein